MFRTPARRRRTGRALSRRRRAWLERLARLARTILSPPAKNSVPRRRSGAGPARVALDLRNLGTLGLQQDSFPALLWSDALRGRRPCLHRRARDPRAVRHPRGAGIAEAADTTGPPVAGSAQVARGRTIFTERVVGTIANRGAVEAGARPYRAARCGTLLGRIDPADVPSVTRIGGALRRLSQRRPLESTVAIARDDQERRRRNTPARSLLHCHLESSRRRRDKARRARRRASAAEVAACTDCHLGGIPGLRAITYRLGWPSPFDADGDGVAQDDETEDQRAGGIGNEALLSFDVPRSERPQRTFTVELPVIADALQAGTVRPASSGVGWWRWRRSSGCSRRPLSAQRFGAHAARAPGTGGTPPAALVLGEGAGRFVLRTAGCRKPERGPRVRDALTAAKRTNWWRP